MAEELTRRQLDRARSCRLFRGVDEIVAERLLLDRRCPLKAYEGGGTLTEAPEFPGTLGILVSGGLRLERGLGADRRLFLRELEEGDCFGLLTVFSGRPAGDLILTARGPAEALLIPAETLRWSMQRNTGIAENYMEALTDLGWFLSESIGALAAGSVRERLLRHLRGRCGAAGTLTVSMTDLARQLGLGRASLYRAMDALEEEGVLERSGKQITLLQKE